MKKRKNNKLALSRIQRGKIFGRLLVSIFFLFSFAIFFPKIVQADAWWGEGYRSPEWVKANRGTIVYYAIKGKKRSDKYKARMYQGSQRIEIEYGSSGIFDDAISGSYSISASEGNDKIGSVSFSACPGGTLYANFDADKETASISACQKRVAPKTTGVKNEEEDNAEEENNANKERDNENKNSQEQEELNSEKGDNKDENSQEQEELDSEENSENLEEEDLTQDKEEADSKWKNKLYSFFVKIFNFDFLKGNK
jgi:hypothetical protein